MSGEMLQELEVDDNQSSMLPTVQGHIESSNADTPLPPELFRLRSGSTITDPDSVYSEDSGRSYHGYKDGKYFFPNDEAEQDRLDLQHKSFKILLHNRLFLAPLPPGPKNVLDVATGTGLWAMDFARQHPDAQVIGTDLSAIQPDIGLPNCTFIKEDSEEDWLYPGIPGFDYVHLRFVFSCFNDHRKVMTEAFNNITPGGWIEYQDVGRFMSLDGSLEGTAIETYTQLGIAGAAKLGRDINISAKYKDMLIETGFVDVVEHKLIWPSNPWSDDLRLWDVGRWQQQNIKRGIRGIGFKVLAQAGLGNAEIEDLVSNVIKESEDTSRRLYWPVWIVYGRKPTVEEITS